MSKRWDNWNKFNEDGSWSDKYVKHLESNIKELEQKVEKTGEIAFKYGGYDGGHHKMWVIDQMVRILMGDKYDAWRKAYCDGEDGPNTYEWDEGIAP